VGHAARQISDGFHLLGLAEQGFKPFGFLIGSCMFDDIRCLTNEQVQLTLSNFIWTVGGFEVRGDQPKHAAGASNQRG
jgi:hypothetical protein